MWINFIVFSPLRGSEFLLSTVSLRSGENQVSDVV